MSIWKNNAFFHVEETPEEKNKTTETPKPSAEGATSFTRRLPSLSDEGVITRQDTHTEQTKVSNANSLEFIQHFDSVLQNANMPTPNYISFSKMVGKMGNIPDEAKFMGAFAALETQGLTKASLISSANSYLTILDNDNNDFKNAVQEKLQGNSNTAITIQNNIQANNNEMERIKKETAEAIKKLEESRDLQIKQLQEKNKTLEDQVAPLEQSSRKINDNVNMYDSACTQYKNTIKNDLNKIQSLIN